MSEAQVEIELEGSADIARALLGATPSSGTRLDLGDGVVLSYRGTMHERDLSPNDILVLVLSFPVGVAATVVGDRLLRHLRAAGYAGQWIVVEGLKIQLGQWFKFERTLTRIVDSSRSESDAPSNGDADR
jgi:hypothetical protein